jgi:hypothetical protein
MTASKGSLKERLSRYRQMKKEVWEDDLHARLVRSGGRDALSASGTRCSKTPSIRIDARGAEAELRAQPITESKMLKSVIEKFRDKYGAGDVKKYYSKFDVAVVIQLT